MKVSEFAEKLELTAISLPEGDREIGGCYAGDLLSWVMGRAQADDVWLTIMNNINVLAVASLVGVSAVILAEGVVLGEKEAEAARTKGINVLTSEKSVYALCAEIGKLL